jgi:hypothetical protein
MIWKIAQGSEPVPKLPASIRDRGRQLRQALVG